MLTKDGANTGNVALNTIDGPFSLLSSVCLIKTQSTSLIPAFLCYYLQSPDGLKSITGQMTGAAIKRIILRDIKLATIPLPLVPEQKRIVSILDEAFEGIATAKASAEKNLQNARALFDSHLQSVFTERGEGWEEKTLQEIAIVFGRGKSPNIDRETSQSFTVESIHSFKQVISDMQNISSLNMPRRIAKLDLPKASCGRSTEQFV